MLRQTAPPPALLLAAAGRSRGRLTPPPMQHVQQELLPRQQRHQRGHQRVTALPRLRMALQPREPRAPVRLQGQPLASQQARGQERQALQQAQASLPAPACERGLQRQVRVQLQLPQAPLQLPRAPLQAQVVREQPEQQVLQARPAPLVQQRTGR